MIECALRPISGSLLVFWEDEAEFLEKAGDHLCDGTNGWVMLLFFFVICITFNGLQEALPNQVRLTTAQPTHSCIPLTRAYSGR